MNTETPSGKLLVKQKEKSFIINMNDIVYLKSQNNYTKILLTNNTELTYTKCLKQMMNKLDDSFCRINQSYAVNLHHIKEVIFDEKNLIMTNDQKVKFTLGVKDIHELIEKFIKNRTL
jgi:two-component system LytT family response regulator